MKGSWPLAALLAACGGGEVADGTANEVPIGIAPAPGVYPFQGAWAGSEADCVRDTMRRGDGLTVITTRTIIRSGRACDILGVTAAEGTASYAVSTDCDADGPRYRDTANLTVDGDALTIADDAGTATLRRCAPSARGE